MSYFRSSHPQLRSIRRARRIITLAPFVLVGVSLLVYPRLSLDNGASPVRARVFQRGLEIQIDSKSPAFAAFEEARLHLQFDASSGDEMRIPALPTGVRFLESGVSSAEPMAYRVLALNSREEHDYRRVRRTEDTLRRQTALAIAHATQQIFAKAARKFAPNPEEPAEAARDAAAEAPSALAHPSQNASTERAPTRPRLAVTSSAGGFPVVRHAPQKISLTDLRKSRDELLRELLLPLAASFPNARVFAAGQEREAQDSYQWPRRKRPVQAARAPKPVLRQDGAAPSDPEAFDSTGGLRKKDTIVGAAIEGGLASSSDVAFDATTADIDQDKSEEPVLEQVMISGSVQLAGGLAFTSPDDEIVVYRVDDGEGFEAGVVWIKEARYEIFVERAEGELVAELVAAEGEVIGRAILDLSDLSRERRVGSDRRIETVPLEIRKIPLGIQGSVIAADSNPSKPKPLPETIVTVQHLPYRLESDKDGRWTGTDLLEGSTVLLKAERPDYWGTQAFAVAGSETTLELFPDKMMTAFIELSQAQTGATPERAQNAGVIWGRVTRNGKAAQGATVDLLTTEKALKPVYFNALMIPDPSLNATSANGLYAFFPVPPGAHALAARHAGQEGEPEVFPLERQTVSKIDLDMGIKQTAKLKIFDAFNPEFRLPAEVNVMGSERFLVAEVSGDLELPHAQASTLLNLEVNAGSQFERVRLSIARGDKNRAVPMISREWLRDCLARLKINRSPDTGTVVGFVQGDSPYRVALDDVSAQGQAQIIYFDGRGRVTGADSGVVGGGFILTNLPEGYRTLILESQGRSKIFASTQIVQRNIVNVLTRSIP